MTTRADMFQEFLDKNNLNMFNRQDMNDEIHTGIFRTAFGIEGKNIPAVVVVDDSAFCMIQVHMATTVLRDDNKLKLYDAINRWNTTLKPFKFILDQQGNLVLVACLLNEDGKMDGDKVNAMLNTILDYLNKEHKNVLNTVVG
ncbi:MAG: YbjN domain-containing protein [Anaerovibrio sp.]|uniref:YbjN domain-containing protein n=1 Tax=Anaerovibrio sp. TaxID=1872532 RepID=UPI0025FCB72C|nr:YbjN domain-containing protein [Anaerovibrio sp.]MCR5176130.1 YbjN domain-containing protein [Anaerovibrio sp.]